MKKSITDKASAFTSAAKLTPFFLLFVMFDRYIDWHRFWGDAQKNGPLLFGAFILMLLAIIGMGYLHIKVSKAGRRGK
jgi:hypothetical protein